MHHWMYLFTCVHESMMIYNHIYLCAHCKTKWKVPVPDAMVLAPSWVIVREPIVWENAAQRCTFLRNCVAFIYFSLFSWCCFDVVILSVLAPFWHQLGSILGPIWPILVQKKPRWACRKSSKQLKTMITFVLTFFNIFFIDFQKGC